jgi:hypothetical protein
MPQEFVEALFIVAIIGGIFGVIGGFFGSKRRLIGSILLGMIGGIALASIVRIAGYDPVIPIQEDFSALWAAVGGLVLGYVVSRSTA